MRQLIIYLLVIFTFITNAYGDDIQQPISINPPSFLSNVDNGLDPVNPYQEYGTDGKPTRTPIPFATLPCAGGTASQCHFPTNKWFTDLIFKASAMSAPGVDDTAENFAVGQSPYVIRFFDDVNRDKTGLINHIPGLYIKLNDPYVVVQPQGPTVNGIFRDTYVKTLQTSEIYHFGLTMPINPADNNSKDYSQATRQILDDGQLHLTSQWTLKNNPQGKLTNWLTRGSPYVTVQYENLPLTLFFTDSSVVAIAAEDGGAINVLNNFPEAGMTGQRFRFIILIKDEKQASLDPNSKNPTYSYPLLYAEYILVTSQQITLMFQDRYPLTNPKASVYQLLYSKEQPANMIVRIAYVGGNSALDPASGQPTGDIATATTYVLNNILLPMTNPGRWFIKTENMLFQYANVYPTAATINLQSNQSEGSVIFNWQVEQFALPDHSNFPVSTNQLLMLGFDATHKNYLSTEDTAQTGVDPTYAPVTIRGKMFPIAGKTWTLKVPLQGPNTLPQNLWEGDTSIPDEYKGELITILQSDAKMLIDPNIAGTYGNTLIPIALNDSYAFGKQIARLARLVVLANQLGDQESLQQFLTPLKYYLSFWFDGGLPTDPIGNKQDFFKYDPRFGGVITARASFKPDAPGCLNPDGTSVCGYNQDFYNGQFTDHHFHFGYFIYSAAVLGKFDSNWLNQYKDKVDLLVRDISNPSSDDPYFTPYRYFDWFEGHAYANGLVPGGSGRNQESTSEGLNAWYGIALWGEVTGRSFLKDIGLIMANREILAAQAWTQISPGKSIYYAYVAKANTPNNKHEKDIYMDEGIVTGINWANKIDHGTFFGTRLTYMVGIQLMPYTPATAALLSTDWLTNTHGALIAAIEQRLAYLNTYKVFSQNPNDAIGYFAVEWPAFEANTDPTLDVPHLFWSNLQGLPKDAFQWSLINALALAPIDANKAYNYFAQNANGAFYNALAIGENAFEMAGIKSDTNPSPIVNYYNNCPNTNPNGPNPIYPDTCFNYLVPNQGQQIAVVPYFSVSYDIIDRGMSITNSMWWIYTYKKDANPPSLYWGGSINLDRITGNSATISWPAPIALPLGSDSNISYLVKVRGFNQEDKAQDCGNASARTCSINGLLGEVPYLITITAIENSTQKPRGSLTRSLRIYTLSSGIIATINWPGAIQVNTVDKNTVDLSWEPATLDPPNTPATIMHQAQVYEVGNTTNPVGGCPVGSGLTCRVAGLTPDTQYYAKVNATAEGKAAEVDKQSADFSTNPPVEPKLTWDNNAIQVSTSDTSATITWNAASLTPPGTINYSANAVKTDDQKVYDCQIANSTSCQINNLPVGDYKITVMATADPNLSQPSQTKDFIITGNQPSLTWNNATGAVNLDGNNANVSWSAAQLQNGTGSIQYQVALQGTSGCATTDLKCVIDASGLSPGDYPLAFYASNGNLKAQGPTNVVLHIPTLTPSLTWPDAAVSVLKNGTTISINWNTATLKNSNEPIEYTVSLEQNTICQVTALNCDNDISKLAAGKYTVSVNAKAGALSVPGPSTTFDIPATDHPTFTACRRTSPPPRVMVTFSAVPGTFKSWVINDTVSVTGTQSLSNPRIWAIDQLKVVPNKLTITYEDNTAMTQPVVVNNTNCP